MDSKICTKCEKLKPLSEFGNIKTTKDGKQARCKECTSEYYREYYKKNKDHIIKRCVKWGKSTNGRVSRSKTRAAKRAAKEE